MAYKMIIVGMIATPIGRSAAASRNMLPAFVRAPTSTTNIVPISRGCLSSVAGAPAGSCDSGKDGEGGSKLNSVMSTPWAMAETKRKGRKNKSRFRQHVNPLARRFQMETELPEAWPKGTFDDPTKPLHLDIGCGKGGFLLDLATKRLSDGHDHTNYIGLEIRPNVVQHAKGRIPRWNLTGHMDFIGCNANVDLRRLLNLYEGSEGQLETVSIQFPDPHFKASHAKRRVVTPELVTTLAEFLTAGKEVFIQSDVLDLFNDMRERFREESGYFTDTVEDFNDYLPDNPIGVPTEREVSVLVQNLPVYRTVFRRTDKAVE